MRADVRIVTATNRNLEALMTDGGFRSDLYFRLNVARIRLPALRERREDIPLLLTHYLRVIRERLRRDVDAFTAGALEVLTRYDWPGNIRELKNVVERLIMNASSRQIDVPDLPEEAPGRSRIRARCVANRANAAPVGLVGGQLEQERRRAGARVVADDSLSKAGQVSDGTGAIAARRHDERAIARGPVNHILSLCHTGV